jgi:hypothetical protein
VGRAGQRDQYFRSLNGHVVRDDDPAAGRHELVDQSPGADATIY